MPNTIGAPVQIQWLGRLDKYGESTNGSITQVVLIAAFQVVAIPDASSQNQGNLIKITDFAACVDSGGVNSRFYIQKSTDGNNWTTIARITLPVAGNYHRTYSKPKFVTAGQYCRVIMKQGTAAGASVELTGETAQSDVVDI